MPTIILKGTDRQQWLEGKPGALVTLLQNSVLLLRNVNAKLVKGKGKEPDRYEIDGDGRDPAYRDVTPIYNRMLSNIDTLFKPGGDDSLISHKEKAMLDGKPTSKFVDYSALLGAYFRSQVEGPDGKPIVELEPEQLEALHEFVKPLATGGFSPQQYLESIKSSRLYSTPQQQHKKVLRDLIFLGVTPTREDDLFQVMFKGKHKKESEAFFDSLLTMADFVRTPFAVLQAEADAANIVAKKAIKAAEAAAQEKAALTKAPVEKIPDIQPRVTPLELQRAGAIKGISTSMKELLLTKKAAQGAKNTKEQAAANIEKIKDETIQQAIVQIEQAKTDIDGSFAIAQNVYKERAEAAIVLKQVLSAVGQDTLEGFNKRIADLRTKVVADSKGALQAKDVEIMPLESLSAHMSKVQAEELADLKQKFDALTASLGGISLEGFAEYVVQLRANVFKGYQKISRDVINKWPLGQLVTAAIEMWREAHKRQVEKVETLEQQLSTQAATLAEVQAEVESLGARAKELEAELTTLRESTQAQGKTMGDISADKARIEQEKETATATVLRLRAENADLQAQLRGSKEITPEVARLSAKVVDLEKQLQELDALRASSSEHVSRIVTLSAEKEVLVQEKARLLGERDAAKVDSAKVKLELQELKGSLESRPAPKPEVEKEDPKLEKGKDDVRKALLALSQIGIDGDEKLGKYILDYQKSIETETDVSQLKQLKQEVEQLIGITGAVKAISTTLRKGDILFSSGEDKAKAIEDAMKAIPPKDRLVLVKMGSDKTMEKDAEPESEYPNCTKFIEALSKQRALIFKTNESSSFKTFKSKMTGINTKDDSPDVTAKI